MKETVMLNKFYVGSREISNAVHVGVNHDWTCATLEIAIARAKKKIIDEDLDALVIVQMVRIVRKRTPPLSVEMIK
jgi:hypothetical protein